MNTQSKPIDQSKLAQLGFDVTKLKNTRRGRPRVLSDEQEKTVVQLLKAGFTIRSVASALGINKNTILNIKARFKAASKEADTA